MNAYINDIGMVDVDRSESTATTYLNGITNAVLPLTRCQRILVPVSFSPGSRRAVNYAGLLAQRSQASVDLLHVVEPRSFLSGMEDVPIALSEEQVAEDASIELATLLLEELPYGVKATPHIRKGRPEKVIAAVVRELRADLVVLPRSRAHRWKRILGSDMVCRISRVVTCPVLLIGSGDA